MLNQKNIIITGCNRGIGLSILKLFAANHANIFACIRTKTEEFENTCNNLIKEYNIEITPIYFDLANEEEIKVAVKQIMSTKKQIHGLVNNAGISYNSLFQMSSMDKVKETFQINFFSQYLLTQYISKLMIRYKFGSIVNISSSAAIDGNSGRSAYGASKAALLCMSKTIANELADFGIRVNTVAPGITDTDMVGQSMTESIITQTIQNTKLKRIGKPKEIADTVLFLISDLSSYITGQTIRVDGGIGK